MLGPAWRWLRTIMWCLLMIDHLMALPICDPISLSPSSLFVLSFLFLSPSPSAAKLPPAATPSMPSGNTNLLTWTCSRSQQAYTNRCRKINWNGEWCKKTRWLLSMRGPDSTASLGCGDRRFSWESTKLQSSSEDVSLPVAVIKASIQSLSEFHWAEEDAVDELSDRLSSSFFGVGYGCD